MRTRSEKVFLAIILTPVVLVAITIYGWAPPVYWGAPIEGRVVDEKTGEPIEGAVVFAKWNLMRPHIFHGGTSFPIHTEITETGPDGFYRIPGWGPKLRPAWAWLVIDPTILIYESGYAPNGGFNYSSSNSFVRRSQWDGKMFALEPHDQDPRSRKSRLEGILWTTDRHPRVIREVLQEEDLIEWPGAAKYFFRELKETLRERGEQP